MKLEGLGRKEKEAKLCHDPDNGKAKAEGCNNKAKDEGCNNKAKDEGDKQQPPDEEMPELESPSESDDDYSKANFVTMSQLREKWQFTERQAFRIANRAPAVFNPVTNRQEYLVRFRE